MEGERRGWAEAAVSKSKALAAENVSGGEALIIAERKKTGFGRDRLARILREQGVEVKSTVRYVLKRYSSVL